MESTSCAMVSDHLAKPVRLTQHMSCLRTCHRLYTIVRCIVSHGSAVAGHACVNGDMRWLLGLIQYSIACTSCTSESSFMCCAHVTEDMVCVELTRNVH